MGCDYLHDSWDMYWDLIDLMVTHYAGNNQAFDIRCWNIADKVCRAGNAERALWIDHMVETQKPPSREWESEHFGARESEDHGH